MAPWQESGCEVCRKQWETGKQPAQISTSIGRHAHLHHCGVCGTYWEQNERSAEPLSEAKAREFYPDAFDQEH